jgi:hypothetical protein
MANQKTQGGRQQKQNKSPTEQSAREPMRKPDEDGRDEQQRDRSSNRDAGDVDSSSVIENDEEVELDEDDLEDDESNQITGRHPSQRDRDVK